MSSSSSEEDRVMAFGAMASAAVRWWEEAESSSRPLKRSARLNRDRAAANTLLLKDYFDEGCLYGEEQFNTRFRMSRRLFLKINTDLERDVPWFRQRVDARGRVGFTSIQKCTTAIRQMAYGTASDSFDDYLKMSERTIRSCIYKFSKAIILLYGQKYLRKPSASDIQQLYAFHEAKHGFVGMLGSIDCTHWDWRNCPNAWRGQFARGDHPRPSIMLEAVASNDLWFWHAFFGVAGANNDINVLNQSPIFDDMINGTAPDSSFELRGSHYKRGYYLADGIYPEYATIVKSLTCPKGIKRNNYKKAHEAARKDIERAFCLLKNKWHIIERPARSWSQIKIRNIMYACVILHNMILEDQGATTCQYNPNEEEVMYEEIDEDQKRVNRQEIRNREIHNALKADLIEYIYEKSNH
ncbi:hypothetical protein L1987_35392 [Smallanthus sonchifolius]|uniref:Uncharacterized protein n=1 Tax=Smallanthus sonchifolius TaxID=185202 RepID=A0ACB9HWC3_9ASTR|nr:hypothetical protein L1987_35392 [Smallanthus sonchifolius]